MVEGKLGDNRLLDECLAGDRTEGQARAEVARRRAQMVADLRAEGASDAAIDRLATDEAAANMVAYERQCVGQILGLFAGVR